MKKTNIWDNIAKVDKATWVKTALMIVVLINQALSLVGKSPLPISNDEVQEWVSLAFTVVASIYTMFTNNPITKKDRVAKDIATKLNDVDYDETQYYKKYLK